MSCTEVAEIQVPKSHPSQSDLLKNNLNIIAKENPRKVINESEKNYSSTQLEGDARKICFEEGLNEARNAEFVVNKESMEVPKRKNSLERSVESEKPVTGLVVNSNDSSNSAYPIADQSIASKLGTLMKLNYINNLFYEEYEDFDNLGNRRDRDYKSYFDAMYAKVLEDTGTDELYDDIKIILSPGCVDDSVESINKVCFSENKKECEFLSQVGLRDLVLIPDSKLFCETQKEYEIKTTYDDNAGPIYTNDDRKDRESESKMNNASIEQGATEDSNTKRKVHALEIRAVDFKAKNNKPIVMVDKNTFRISFDVSFFDIENIACIVSDKLDVHARVCRRSDYGSETHEIHQVFDVPDLADRENFTAFIKNGLLYLEAPMKHSTETLTDVS